jgi:hypothetical protein
MSKLGLEYIGQRALELKNKQDAYILNRRLVLLRVMVHIT